MGMSSISCGIVTKQNNLFELSFRLPEPDDKRTRDYSPKFVEKLGGTLRLVSYRPGYGCPHLEKLLPHRFLRKQLLHLRLC